MERAIEIGTVTVGRGQKARGALPLASCGDGSSIQLPLLVVAGHEPGPTMVVSGGVHGDEYEGPRAIQIMWRELDPTQLRGIFLGVPVVNVPAFEVGKRESPVDGLNMNRIFPGRPDGFISERIAYHFIHDVVFKADYYLDLHAGGNAFAMVPVVVYLETGSDEFILREVALAKAAGLDLLWKGTGHWSSAHVEAARHGILAILAEIGEEGRCRQDRLDLALRVIRNVMIHAKMIDGAPQLPQQWIVVAGTYMHSSVGGCFYPMRQVREMVRQGEAIGFITDLWGQVLETIQAPYDGLLMSTRTLPSIRPGEWTAFVGKILDVWEQ